MYGVEVLAAAPAPPVTAAELRARLRLNDQAEDPDLDEFIAAAVEKFEHDTHGQPVLATTYRQTLSAWPCGPIVLGRGGITSVTAVKVYQADGSTVDLAADQWRADLVTPPARVYLAATPAAITTATGIPVSPVGAVEFVAGWPSIAAVPRMVKVALKLLAAHWYEHREAYREGKLEELPDGWRAVVAKFDTKLAGHWGQ
jgi:uncharacterized phiE125 gp8 family phage protein